MMHSNVTNTDTIFELFQLISRGIEHIPARKKFMKLRKAALSKAVYGSGFKKLAFDTRYLDQETEYNPRRGLQNYNRSEEFISEILQQKLQNFAKLREALEDLRREYGKEHEWQDSNARVLLSTLDNGLRTIQKDGNYTLSQPSLGSLDYIEELMYVRYRLGFDELSKLSKKDLKKIILSRDEELIRKDINSNLEISKKDIGIHSYDTLLEKLFTIAAPDQDQPIIERSITITIRDSLPNVKTG